MRFARFAAIAAMVTTSLLLGACGGGGAGTSSSGDINPFVRAAAVATGLDRFLLYPNPVVNAAGAFEVGAAEYAQAYYRAIDPTNAKDTLAKWKAVNRIGDTSGGQLEYQVIVGDQRDLGYGRRMTAHLNPDGTMAFVVDNYLVGAYGGYSPLNLEAAIHSDHKSALRLLSGVTEAGVTEAGVTEAVAVPRPHPPDSRRDEMEKRRLGRTGQTHKARSRAPLSS